MSTTMDSEGSLPRGEGYLMCMGYLQIGAGSFTALISFLAIGQALFGGEMPWFGSSIVGRHDQMDFFEMLVRYYLVFQVALGWLLGLAMVAAGFLSLRHRGRRFIQLSAVVNLLMIPQGSTVAIMVLHGLSRPGIAAVFERKDADR